MSGSPAVPLIRPARDDDAPGVIDLIGTIWRAYGDQGIVFDVDAELPELKAPASAFARQGGAFHVAEAACAVIGSVAWVPVPGGVELLKLYVAAPARRLGLAGRLCALVEDAARARGAGFVELWSDSRFTDAHRLYAARGYVRGSSRALEDLSRSIDVHFRLELNTL